MTDFDHWRFVEDRTAAGSHVVQFASDGPMVLHHPSDCDLDTCMVKVAAETYTPGIRHQHPIVVDVAPDGHVRPAPAHWSDVVTDGQDI